ncbi:DEAD/DEAH box helicase family protein [Methylobacterium sp. CM6257]
MHRTEFHSTNLNETAGSITAYLLASPPGGGKTETIIDEMATMPAVYLYVLPRIGLIEEQEAWLRAKAAAGSRSPTIVVIHSRMRGVKRKVVTCLRDAINGAVDPHTVIITTHAAAMALDPSEFEGLHVRWDELPEGATPSGSIGLGTSWPALAERYILPPGDEPGWFRVMPRPGAEPLSLGQIRGDVANKLVEFHRLVASGGRVVEVNIADWANAGVAGAPPVRWRSIWSLVALRHAASLKVAAAGYPGSLADHAVRRAGGLRVEPVRVGRPRTGQPQIKIYWYTPHPGSTGWWRTDTGKRCIVAISRHLEAMQFTGYWASNGDIEDFFYGRLDGADQCSPKMAGSNSLRHHEACAMIYSAKMTPDDESIVQAFRLDRDDIRTAREGEDVFQFVCRGAIRDPGYSGRYDVYVYDLGQAEHLRARLLDSGYEDVILVAVPEAGIMEINRPQKVRRVEKSVSNCTVETATERRERERIVELERGRRRRAQAKAIKITEGVYRSRGRPQNLRA